MSDRVTFTAMNVPHALTFVGESGPENLAFPKGAKVAKMLPTDSDGLRLMLIITSNAYLDRTDEIIKLKALQEYADSCWDGDTFIGSNPLLVWHGGDPVGEIIYTDVQGAFLVEVAKELPDGVVNLANMGESPIASTIKTVWDMMQAYPDSGASHKFLHLAGDELDSEYDTILKVESSWLPRWAAANAFTDAEVIDL